MLALSHISWALHTLAGMGDEGRDRADRDIDAEDVDARWPSVDESEWCGEFKAEWPT